MKSKIVSETGIVHTGVGTVSDLVINSHTSGTIKLIDGTENSVVATGTLTSTGACVPASHGQNVLTSTGAMVAGTHAVSVLTGDAVVEGNVVVVGAITYTAKRVPTLPYHVALGADTETFLANLKAAINGVATSVQAYEGTTAHPQIVAVASDATTLTVRGRVPGTSLNAVATTGTALRTVWADTTLGGGTGASDAGVTTAAATATLGAITYTVVDALSETYGATAIPYQVLKGASEATMLDNLKLAINATGTAGTQYSTGTVAHPQLVATTNTDTAQTVISRTIGDAAATAIINALPTTETMANTSWADTTFGGGTGASNPAVTSDAALITIGNKTYTATIELSETSGATAVADQVLWVTSEAVFLDNLKKAINQTGIAGTDYSTGTTQHTQVLATTNANDSQVVQARLLGSAQNSIATTDTLANYAWGSTTLTSGAGATGRVLFDTITFSAVATTGERWIDLGEAEFYYGLFAVVGGTANTTLVYNHN